MTITADSDPGAADRHLASLEDLAQTNPFPATRVFALLAAFGADLSPDSLSTRRLLAAEIMDLLGSPECAAVRSSVLPTAYFMYVGSLLESGEIDAVDRALSLEVHIGGPLEEVVRSRFATMFRCSRASMDGDTGLAEQLAGECHTEAIADEDIDADAVWIGQMAVIRWMQGRVSEMEQHLLQARQADPTEIIWGAAAAWIWARQGRLAAARGLCARLPDPGSVPRGRNWLAATAILAEVACQVGDNDSVENLRQLLEPFAERLVPLGLGVTVWGTVARPLALIAVRQGRPAAAIDHYRVAITQGSRFGMQAWLCLAQAELARLLLEHGDPSQANELLAEASSAARHLRLREVEQLVDQLMQRQGLTPSPPHTEPNPESDHGEQQPDGSPSPSIAVFGGFSVTAADGTVATWTSKKARALLKILLARRGDAVARESVIEILWPEAGSTVEEMRRMRNRLAVATATIRRTLDPMRVHPADYFIESTGDVIRLRCDRLAIDIEQFFALVRRARSTSGGSSQRALLLREAFELYRGDPLPAVIYESWAEPLHREAKIAFFDCAHALAKEAAAEGDHYEASLCYQRIIALDPFDQSAHLGLIEALESLGAVHRAEEARAEWRSRKAQLGSSND